MQMCHGLRCPATTPPEPLKPAGGVPPAAIQQASCSAAPVRTAYIARTPRFIGTGRLVGGHDQRTCSLEEGGDPRDSQFQRLLAVSFGQGSFEFGTLGNWKRADRRPLSRFRSPPRGDRASRGTRGRSSVPTPPPPRRSGASWCRRSPAGRRVGRPRRGSGPACVGLTVPEEAIGTAA